MFIKKLFVNNYRNLDGLDIIFNDICNFVIGENNIGKTNILDLIHILFSKTPYRFFSEDDFKDLQKPIIIEITIKLSNDEIGFFEDLFDPSNSSNINIIATQNKNDQFIEFVHKETGQNIKRQIISQLNCIYYSSMQNPQSELSFERKHGAGAFLSFLFKNYLDKNEIEEVNLVISDNMSEVIKYINGLLDNIDSIYGLRVDWDTKATNIVTRLLRLYDNSGRLLSEAGTGVQYISLILMSLLNHIYQIYIKSGNEVGYVVDGKRIISVLFILDEPEIHLNPFAQRSLIKLIRNILSSNNQKFNNLLKGLFDIDELYGQIIIATHSPDILSDTYKEYIRVFENESKQIKSINGDEVVLDAQIENHLLKQLEYIKQSFFAKKVIIFEGDSEYGFFSFRCREEAEFDFDNNQISCIKAESADSVLPLYMLFDKYQIVPYAIIDKDKYKSSYSAYPRFYSTTYLDFEEEIVQTLINYTEEDFLAKILYTYDSSGLNRIIDKDKFNYIAQRYNINISTTTPLKFADVTDKDYKIVMYLSWLEINKKCRLGRIISEILPKNLIPQAYSRTIEKCIKNEV